MKQTNPEDLPETFSEKHPIIIKITTILIALFLLILISVYFLTNPQIRYILAGLIESETINNFQVQLKTGNSLIFTNNTYTELLEIYNNNKEKEFKVCLQGYINKDYIINKIHKPKMFLQLHNQVTAEPCPIESLVSLHSHPLKHCLPSDTDLKNFNLLKKQNPNSLMAIMCEPHRFNFYN